MPKPGDRVFVRPVKGEAVQRGRDLFGQFLPPEGAEVTWELYHQQRLQDGSILLPPAHYHAERIDHEARIADLVAQLECELADLPKDAKGALAEAVAARRKALEDRKAEFEKERASLQKEGAATGKPAEQVGPTVTLVKGAPPVTAEIKESR